MRIHHFSVQDEVLLTQKIFRLLLHAMSNPGKVYSFSINNYKGLISVIQTLLDHEVTFNVVGHQAEEWTQKIIKATGSRPVKTEDADFVVIPSNSSDSEILRARRGSLEYPDTGATLVYYTNSLLLKDNEDLRITLKGPGINSEITPFIGSIKKEEFHYLREINSEYPLGVDSIFIDSENRLMCIPRSTRIEMG